MVVMLELMSFAVFAVMVLPRLPQHRVQGIMTICLGSMTLVHHYRYVDVIGITLDTRNPLRCKSVLWKSSVHMPPSLLCCMLDTAVASGCVQGSNEGSRLPDGCK
jgi:hypothetical protein